MIILPFQRRRARAPRRRSEAGLTTLEAVIAMGIAAVASFTVATSTTTSFRAVDRSERTANVENAMRESVESIKTVDYVNLETLDGNKLFVNDDRRDAIIQLTVSQVSPTMKAVEVDAFEKQKTNGVWTAGLRIGHALVLRAER